MRDLEKEKIRKNTINSNIRRAKSCKLPKKRD